MNKNPTVPINVTAKELRVLRGLLGYDTHCITLRDKISAADDAMRLATRQKNREAKAARLEKKKALLTGNRDHTNQEEA